MKKAFGYGLDLQATTVSWVKLDVHKNVPTEENFSVYCNCVWKSVATYNTHFSGIYCQPSFTDISHTDGFSHGLRSHFKVV